MDFPHLNSTKEELTGTVCNTYALLDILIVVLDAKQTGDADQEDRILRFADKG